ncbi:MAG: tRNA-dihydrouridine synthase [Planctomycetes bacterium]|nr:tRNA-dihydrouridine synthase [Planctomycetota bacterium]
MLKIGTIELNNPFLQAALSGYTDYPMRILAKRFGCALVLTGVMLDRISLHPKAIRQSKFHCRADEHPIAAQIFGDNPEVIAQSAVAFRKLSYDMIDLNFACPVPKVLRRERGGWLMRKPGIVREAFRRTRDAVDCPVTIKLRIGYDGSEAAKGDFWEIIENAAADGVDAIGIHGRTVEQKYKGKADWSVITEVKKRFPRMTVFGSGDLMDAATVMQRLHESGVDGVLIARGAIGNPWIFRECVALREGRQAEPPSLAEQAEIMLEHFEMIQKTRPGRRGVSFFRKFSIGYIRRLPKRKKALLPFMTVKDPALLRELIAEWFQKSS